MAASVPLKAMPSPSARFAAAASQDFLDRACPGHAIADDDKFLLCHVRLRSDFQQANIDHETALRSGGSADEHLKFGIGFEILDDGK